MAEIFSSLHRTDDLKQQPKHAVSPSESDNSPIQQPKYHSSNKNMATQMSINRETPPSNKNMSTQMSINRETPPSNKNMATQMSINKSLSPYIKHKKPKQSDNNLFYHNHYNAFQQSINPYMNHQMQNQIIYPNQMMPNQFVPNQFVPNHNQQIIQIPNKQLMEDIQQKAKKHLQERLKKKYPEGLPSDKMLKKEPVDAGNKTREEYAYVEAYKQYIRNVLKRAAFAEEKYLKATEDLEGIIAQNATRREARLIQKKRENKIVVDVQNIFSKNPMSSLYFIDDNKKVYVKRTAKNYDPNAKYIDRLTHFTFNPLKSIPQRVVGYMMGQNKKD